MTKSRGVGVAGGVRLGPYTIGGGAGAMGRKTTRRTKRQAPKSRKTSVKRKPSSNPVGRKTSVGRKKSISRKPSSNSVGRKTSVGRKKSTQSKSRGISMTHKAGCTYKKGKCTCRKWRKGQSHLKKYLNRPSPPFPANKHCGKVKRGNDGKMWVSVKNVKGICRWVRKAGRKTKRK
jgi:hypothetical protein